MEVIGCVTLKSRFVRHSARDINMKTLESKEIWEIELGKLNFCFGKTKDKLLFAFSGD